MPHPTEGQRPVITLIALTGVLAATLGLAAWLTTSRRAAEAIKLGPAVSVGDVTIAVPEGFRRDAQTRPAGTDDGGVMLVASDPAAITSDPAAPEKDTFYLGGRGVEVSLSSPPRFVPPGEFLSEFARVPRGASEPMSLGGHPGVLASAQFQLRGESDPARRSRFGLLAAATLPSGRVVSVVLAGPGRPTGRDRELIERIAATLSVRSEPQPTTPHGSEDPFASLRARPVVSPLEASADPQRPVSRRLVVPYSGQVATLEVFPVYLPPAPGGEEQGSSEAAEAVTRWVAGTQDAALRSAVFRRLTPTRVLLTPEARGEHLVRGLIVTSPTNPGLAALLVMRGPVELDGEMARLLNRAADRLVFEARADDLATLVSAGTELAAKARAAATIEPLTLAFRRPGDGPGTAPAAVSRITAEGGGTVDTRRVQRPLRPVSRSLRTAKALPGGSATVFVSRQAWDGQRFVDVRAETLQVPALSALPAAAPTSAAELARALAGGRTYVPGHRLMAALAQAGDAPAILVTDALPGADFEALPPLWVVLVAPMPEAPATAPTAGATRAVVVYPMGASRPLIARFDAEGRLTGLDLPGDLLGTPAREAELPTQGVLAP